jgi:hypothetical protein
LLDAISEEATGRKLDSIRHLAILKADELIEANSCEVNPRREENIY